jgi:ABC-type sugar transport system ATPase subunit
VILSLQKLTKRYGGCAAVDAMALDMPAGAFVVILGPAGAGKTTTLRLVAGLEEPDEGRIHLAGRDMAGVPPSRRDLAMIFDNLALYPGRTGFENIAFPLRVAGRPVDEIKKRVAAVGELLRISHVLGRLPRTMSGGERQRVALGRALVRNPALFLLDEPLSSLDAMLRFDLRAELRRLQAEHGYSFLMATPDYAEALAIADTVVVLSRGKVLQVGSPQEIYDQPIDRETARFVGAPEINLLRTVVGEGRLVLGESQIRLPPALAAKLPAPANAVELGVRPEDVLVGPQGSGSIAGRVLDLEPLGLQSTVTVEVQGGRVVATLGSDACLRPDPGDPVALSFREERLHAFDPTTGLRL